MNCRAAPRNPPPPPQLALSRLLTIALRGRQDSKPTTLDYVLGVCLAVVETCAHEFEFCREDSLHPLHLPPTAPLIKEHPHTPLQRTSYQSLAHPLLTLQVGLVRWAVEWGFCGILSKSALLSLPPKSNLGTTTVPVLEWVTRGPKSYTKGRGAHHSLEPPPTHKKENSGTNTKTGKLFQQRSAPVSTTPPPFLKPSTLNPEP